MAYQCNCIWISSRILYTFKIPAQKRINPACEKLAHNENLIAMIDSAESAYHDADAVT